MKTFKFITLIMLSVLSFTACSDDDNDELTGDQNEGGLITVNNLLVPYVVGNTGPYDASVGIYQGRESISSISVYKRFVSAAGAESNTELLKTISVSNTSTGSNITQAFDMNYSELISGLTVNGAALPADDSGLTIGDAFILSYKTTQSDGSVRALPNNGSYTTKVAVGTRLAGTYTIQQGWYIHPSTAPGLAGDYSGTYNRVIESVALETNFTTYKSTTMGWGSAGGWDDPACNFFYFYVNNIAEADGTFLVTIPETYNGNLQTLWCSDPMANCINTPGNLPDVSCTDKVTLMDDGHDVIELSYGYTRSSGTRQFDEILIKQ